MRSKREETRLPAGQARLLRQINQGFTETWWDHYHDLIGKRQDYDLNDHEHRELIRLTDQLEKQEVKRLQALVKLAKLRKQSLNALMKDLGLPGNNDG
jgi:hypothetical protein